MSLSNKYRPKSFEDVLGQDITTTILKNKLKNGDVHSNLLFLGPAGCGKTTCARIFANEIDGEIIEIDSASNNGVSEVKAILSQSEFKSISHKYKVFIFDEAHTITPAAWSSLLIRLEEKIPYSIFIFCTTDAGKIPQTILSRLQIFQLLPITESDLLNRLSQVVQSENIEASEESLRLIANISNNSLRQALTNLEKCIDFSTKVELDNVRRIFQIASTDDIKKVFLFLSNNEACLYLRELHDNGIDLYKFIEQSLSYFVKLTMYSTTSYITQIEFLVQLMEELRFMIGNPTNVRTYICAKLLCRRA